MGLSPTEARRGLWREGTSFRALRSAALVKRARPLINEGATAEELAFSLGYSDGRSIRRALKTATGLSLADMRNTANFEGTLSPLTVIDRLIEAKRQQM